VSANHIEALAKALYENGNPQHTAADRAMLGPFEALDALQQTIWIDLANAAHNHIGEQTTELEANNRHLSNNLDVARMGRATAEATIARVEKLAHEMRGWCSPYGFSVTYADRIFAALEGE